MGAIMRQIISIIPLLYNVWPIMDVPSLHLRADPILR
jgi:hypothetical protein